MKKLMTILFVVLLVFSIGCTVQEEEQEPLIEADGALGSFDEAVVEDTPAVSSGETCAEAMPKLFTTVDEMVNAVQQERQAKSKDSIAQANELEKLSTIYVPANEFEGFQLWNIEVNPYSVFYYYMPVDNTSSMFSSSKEILVTLYRNTKFDTRLFFANNGLNPDEDGFAYEAEACEMTFIQDDTAISIQVPDHMNDYDTIRSLCEMEKIEIPWTKEESETGENEPAMPQFSSVDELIAAVQAERQSDFKSALAQSGELESLSYLYAPSNIIAGYFLHNIEVTPDYVILNMPHEEEVEPYLEWECVIFTQYRSEDVTLQSICDQYGLTVNEDGWAYDDDNRRVFYELDGTVIGLQVPEYMNDYDTIHGLCGMEKVEIS